MIKKLVDKLWISPEINSTARNISYYNHLYPLHENVYILFNGLTGAIDAVSSDIYRLLNNKCLTNDLSLNYNEVNYLISRGYITKSKDSEDGIRLQLINSLANDAQFGQISFLICPTNFCRMGCEYCFTYGFTNKSDRKVLSNKQIEAIFERINDISRKKVYQEKIIVFYGGEPFQPFTIKAVEKIFKLAKREGYSIAGFTNGYYLDKFYFVLKQYRDLIKLLSITLDTPTSHDNRRNMKDSFRTVLRNIIMMGEIEGFPIQIKTNIDLNTIKSLEESIKLFKSEKWWDNHFFSFELNPIRYGNLSLHDSSKYDAELSVELVKRVRTNSEFMRFNFLPVLDYSYYFLQSFGLIEKNATFNIEPIKVPKIYNCPSVKGDLFVFDAEGKIYLCNEEIGNQNKVYGMYTDGHYTLDEIELSLYTGRNIKQLKPCTECKFAFICAGGCACYAKEISKVKCPTFNDDILNIISAFKLEILAHLQTIKSI